MSGLIGGIERPLSGGRSGIADVDPWRTMVGRRMGAFDPNETFVSAYSGLSRMHELPLVSFFFRGILTFESIGPPISVRE